MIMCGAEGITHSDDPLRIKTNFIEHFSGHNITVWVNSHYISSKFRADNPTLLLPARRFTVHYFFVVDCSG